MDISNLLHILILLVVLGLVFYLVWWFLAKIGLPEPFNKVAQAIVALVVLLILVYMVLSIWPHFGQLNVR